MATGEKSATYANSLLLLIFNGTTMTSIAANATSPYTSYYCALHSSDPTSAGNQASNEVTTAAYNGYTRVAIARTSAGFVVTGNQAAFAATVSFPTCTGGTGVTASYFSIGTAASGTNEFLYAGPISPTVAIANTVTPSLSAGTVVVES